VKIVGPWRPAVAAGIGFAGVLHAGPVLTSSSVIRRHWPRLSGLGPPGQIALTFDDGPDPAGTPAILELLAEREVHATFFVLGRMLAAAPHLGAEIVAGEHEIAVHGWAHRSLLFRGPAATFDDLARARDLVCAVTGHSPLWWRPPYGVLTASGLFAAMRLGVSPVLWTAWGRDWEARATDRSVVRTAQRSLRGGGTLLLHDSDCTSAAGSWRVTLAALPALLDHCESNGWRVVPLREHLA
jgi:peptidoglycan/xylan/chitin deacetylase (PgdA/CDA1 family)